MDTILKRKSHRKFLDKVVEEDKIEKILRAGMHAPSSFDQRPWEFIVITNREILNKLGEATPYSSCVKECGCAIVPCYKESELKYTDYVICDMSACVENMLLEATYLELGSLWIGGAPKMEVSNNIKNILNIEDRLVPFCIVALGYSDVQRKFEDRYDEIRIHRIV